MAKIGTTSYEKFRKAKPLPMEVHLPMGTDSSAVVAVEIETGLGPGMELGFELVGMDWHYQDILSPHSPPAFDLSTDINFDVQLCRGELPGTPVKLGMGHHDLIYHDPVMIEWLTTVGAIQIEWPRKIRQPEVTQKEQLYLLHVTDVDFTPISLTTIELVATVWYYLVDAQPIHGHDE